MQFHQTNHNAGDVINALGAGTKPVSSTDPCRVVTVHRCQRCNNTHLNLRFTLLDNAVDAWCWWAMCPVKSQPILLKVDERKDAIDV